MAPDAPDFSRLQRALVVKLRHHGDVLLASPVLGALKAHAPHLEIDALVYDDTREMLSEHPALDQLHQVGRRWRHLSVFAQARLEWQLWKTLRARQYDLLIHLTPHPRGAWLARTLGPAVSVAPRREGRWWRSSFTHRYPVVPAGRRHTVEMHLDALRRIGVQPAPEGRRLHLEPGAEAIARIDARLREADLVPGKFVHFHPASRWRFKCWPAHEASALVDALQRHGHRVVITAAPSAGERALVDAIVAGCRVPPIDWAGTLSLKDMAALSARAGVFVGVDSAPMHIAAAVRAPVVALFGPSGEHEWGPWMVPHRIIASTEHPCRPCGLDGCGSGKRSDCLERLPAARVLEAALELLERPAAS
jgi:heptosyltransferase-3